MISVVTEEIVTLITRHSYSNWMIVCLCFRISQLNHSANWLLSHRINYNCVITIMASINLYWNTNSSSASLTSFYTTYRGVRRLRRFYGPHIGTWIQLKDLSWLVSASRKQQKTEHGQRKLKHLSGRTNTNYTTGNFVFIILTSPFKKIIGLQSSFRKSPLLLITLNTFGFFIYVIVDWLKCVIIHLC